jgi:DNA-binding transcriptional LysR family regulator
MISAKDLTVQQLRCFAAVADTQHFTEAAELLKMAQPSLSSQIGRLERTLGVKLFQREHRPVLLTDSGVELLPLARRVLSNLNDVTHVIGEVEGLQRGHVTIGATPSLGASLLASVLARFHDHYPGISLSVVERDSQVLAEELESGALDLALVIMPLRRPTLEDTVLATEELVVIVNAEHPLASRESITIADLRDVSMIMFREGYGLRNVALAAFEKAGIAARVGLDGAEIASVHSYVAAGLGAAIVPSIIATNDQSLRVLTLRSPHLTRTIGLVRPLHHTPSRATAALFEEITSYLAESDWLKKVHSARRGPGAPKGNRTW